MITTKIMMIFVKPDWQYYQWNHGHWLWSQPRQQKHNKPDWQYHWLNHSKTDGDHAKDDNNNDVFTQQPGWQYQQETSRGCLERWLTSSTPGGCDLMAILVVKFSMNIIV